MRAPSRSVPKPRRTLSLLLGAVALAAIAERSWAQEVSEETVRFFKTNCASCHTIGGGRLTGPDLKDLKARQGDREWLVRFVRDPKAVIDAGDPYAANLVREAKGQIMTTIPGMDRARIVGLLDLIDAESALPKSRFAGAQVSDRALTAEDVARGRRLFQGRERTASGAPPCLSCHSLEDAAAAGAADVGFGGGRLGPDLTTVYARLEGRKALTAWLSAPPSPTMQPVFAKTSLEGEEILSLVAYLKDAGERAGTAPRGAPSFLFLVASVAGLAGSLLLFDFLWRGRFRGVRRRLVEGARR